MTNKITTIGIVIGLLFLGVIQMTSNGNLSNEISSLDDKMTILQGNMVVLSASQQALGAASGAAHYQHESFLQGLSSGGRDEFTVDNGGAVNYLESTETVSAANTITVAESGKTFYISTTGATYTLPAVASSAGAVYRFVVGAAFSTNAVIDSAEGDNIEGSMIVAGAVVDCDAEDQINFVADGENLGDFVEVRSNGTNWFITQSNALSSAKLTCTDPT